MARIVNFSYEMFNDALYFYEQAQQVDPSAHNDWIRWRCLRATILFLFASLESVINGLIISKANEIGCHSTAQKVINKSIRISEKIGSIYPRLLGVDIDKKGDLWRNFMEIRHIRVLLSHYTGGTAIYNEDNPNGITLRNAERALEMVRVMVKYLYELGSQEIPPWVHLEKSHEIY